MYLSNPEILLALRSPDSGWLGVLTTVLDEANRDPRFDASQREILHQLLNAGTMTDEVGDAARRRAAHFETQIMQDSAQPIAPETTAMDDNAPERPKLTLIGNVNAG
jgi:hypothetical protein